MVKCTEVKLPGPSSEHLTLEKTGPEHSQNTLPPQRGALPPLHFLLVLTTFFPWGLQITDKLKINVLHVLFPSRPFIPQGQKTSFIHLCSSSSGTISTWYMLHGRFRLISSPSFPTHPMQTGGLSWRTTEKGLGEKEGKGGRRDCCKKGSHHMKREGESEKGEDPFYS